MPLASRSTEVAITNPLVLYRTLLATKRIDPDPAQHRLAIHLQKLYDRLKDYEPVVQYGHRLQHISRTLGSTPGRPAPGAGHDAPDNPNSSGLISSLFEKKQKRDSLAMTRVLTSQEAAMELDSPQGLMLHGEVGTGKSMLIDLFADCLPNRKKRRWHYSTFMLDTFAKLEQLRRSRQMIIPTSLNQQDDYSLLWLARDMISTSPILFIDEFQLPDRAAAKIVTNLMTCFFHLGGVLIATSNRMPEELAKASGMQFASAASTRPGLLGRLGLRSSLAAGKSEQMFSQPTEFSAFLDVLRARCEVWEMENGRDYRRRDAEMHDSETSQALDVENDSSFDGLQSMSTGNIGLGYEQSASAYQEKMSNDSKLPQNFYVKPASIDSAKSVSNFERALDTTLASFCQPQKDVSAPSMIIWKPKTLLVYNRPVLVPRTNESGTCMFDFAELCGASNPLGPADYITLASTFHTLVLTNVPILTSLHKNEARRLITLLDALYEARCKLLITAEAGPDDIFFPEFTTGAQLADRNRTDTVSQDATYAETFSEIYQDATTPFRPNVSVYDDSISSSSTSSHTSHNPADQLEDTPPNTPHASNDPTLSHSSYANPDFAKSQAFTGEDERFAYKRARSRLWEMCGASWWSRVAELDDPVDKPSWWRPLPVEARSWERSVASDVSFANLPTTSAATEAAPKDSTKVSEEGTEEGKANVDKRYSPFRRRGTDPPPTFSWTHAWGMMTWGRKAGAWGKGVEGLEERRAERASRAAGGDIEHVKKYEKT